MPFAVYFIKYLRATEYHLSYGITCHPTQVNTPRYTYTYLLIVSCTVNILVQADMHTM